MEPVTAGLITAGLATAGQAGNMYATGRMNKKTRQWNEQMYERQQADNLKNWNLQNEYNSPTSQMARLRSAGLNPNLVYGNGAVANSTSAPDNANVQNWKPEAPQVDMNAIAGPAINTYFDVQTKEAQIDNLKADNTVKINQAALLDAQRLRTLFGTERDKFGMERDQFSFGLDKEYSAEYRALVNRNLSLTGDNIQQGIKESTSRVAKNWAEIQNIKNETQRKALEVKFLKTTFNQRALGIHRINDLRRIQFNLQALDHSMRKKGINPNDPMYLRVIGQTIDKYIGEGSEEKTKTWWSWMHPDFRD